MIDTVVLTIPWGKYKIARPEFFQPNAERLTRDYSRGCTWSTFVQNPTKADKQSGNYLPRLTIKDKMVRGCRLTALQAEFSVPKLLFGNNLEEAKPENLKQAVSELGLKLFQMGVNVASPVIETAEAINTHFCRNITITDRYTAQYTIRQLGKLNYTKKLDHNVRQFQNDGLAFYLYSKTNQSIFYDKMADIKGPAKRSLDFHHNDYQQLNLYDKSDTIKKEVLRWEVRLTNKAKLVSVLNKLGYAAKTGPFSLLFSQELSDKVLQHYWSKFYYPEANVLFQPSEPAEILETLLAKGYKVQKALQIAMLVATAQASGIRALRSIIEAKTSTRQWYRVEKALQIALKALKTNKPVQFINDIEKAIGLYN